jgi:hypothetical protein
MRRNSLGRIVAVALIFGSVAIPSQAQTAGPSADLGGQLKSHTWGHFKTAHHPVGSSKSHT